MFNGRGSLPRQIWDTQRTDARGGRRRALRRIAPWVAVPIAVGTLLLGGLPLIAILIGALLVAAMLGHGVSRMRRRSASPVADRAVVAWATVIWAIVVVFALASVTHGVRTDLGLPASPLLGHGHEQRTWAILLDLFVVAAAISSAFAIRALSSPRLSHLRLGTRPTAAALQAAQAIVAEHGDDSLAPFVLRPDKSLLFADGGLVAYRVIGDTAVVSADPVGPEPATRAALAALLARARESHMHVAVYGASERYLDVYRELGLHALCVGEEAVVEPERFTLEGRPVRKLRQSVNRIERRGWRVAAYRGRDVDVALEAEIDAVEHAWRSGHEHMLGFAMSLGEYEPGVHTDDLYLLAWSPEGDLRAVMRFIDHRGNLSLDTMRRVGETPNGLNEALISRALTYAREAGVAEVSLNYAGFAHLIREAPTGGRLRRTVTGAFLRVLSGHFQMDRLVLFNDKFSPQWRPRYLVYESAAGLPRAAWRVLQAEGYVPEPRRGSPRSLRRVEGDASQPAVQRSGR